MNAIVPIQPMPFGEIERMADAFAKSNLFGFKTKEQALVLMMLSQAEGRHPALAARDYDVYQNKPAKKAEAMLRDFQASGGVVKWHTLTDEKADATFSHPQAPEPLRIDWDMVRAKKAGLAGKDLWQKYPRSMLRSRVVSEGVRAVWPGATSGMYVPEEMADMATHEPPHNGPTLDHEPTSTPPDPKPETRRDAINRDVPLNPTPPKPARTPAELLDALQIAVHAAGSQEAFTRLIGNRHVQDMLRDYKGDDLAQLQAIIATGNVTYAPVQPPDDAVADIWGDAPVTEPAGAG
jgi:hypothetical protein